MARRRLRNLSELARKTVTGYQYVCRVTGWARDVPECAVPNENCMASVDAVAIGVDHKLRGLLHPIPSDSPPALQPALPLPAVDAEIKIISPWRAALAGSASAMVARTMISPLDKAAIVMQVQQTGSLSSVLSQFRAEGIRSMWQGAGVNALRVGVFGGMVTVGYAWGLKLKKFEQYDEMEPFWRGAVGSVTSVVATIVTQPLDVIRTRLTLQSPSQAHVQYQGIWHAAKVIARQEGVGSLYRGLLPNVLSVAPEVFVQLALYDISVHHAQQILGIEPSAPLFAACGMFVGCTTQIIVYPLDLARRRMQEANAAGRSTTSMGEVFTRVLRTGGPRALYSGLGPACLRVSCAVGIAMAIRDTLLGRLECGRAQTAEVAAPAKAAD